MESKKSEDQKKQKRGSLKEGKKEDKQPKQNKEKEAKPRRKSVKAKSDKKTSNDNIKESEKEDIKKVKKPAKRKSLKENKTKELDKLEKEMKKMEIAEKKKIAREIENKYKEIKFYLPNPFKLDSNELKNLTKLSKDNCLICQEKYKINTEVLYMPCLHLYHKECIIRWLINNDKCPTCKSGYKTENANNMINTSNYRPETFKEYVNSHLTDEDRDILKSLGIRDLSQYLDDDSDYENDFEDDFF